MTTEVYAALAFILGGFLGMLLTALAVMSSELDDDKTD